MYIKEQLEERYGKDFIEKGGLKVYTTLDWELQEAAEKIIFEVAKQNKINHYAHNAALVVIDPKTGQILTMVGSKDYFGEAEPENCISGKNCLFDPNVNITTRLRQPGSSFKPFAYAAAFKKGYVPETIIFDLKTEFGVNNAKSYIPQNYDEKFRGPVSFRQALGQSLNVPSVKVLYLAGIDETLNIAEDLGITTLKDRSRYGLSLVLGGGEVKLLEMSAAFSVFAAEGIKSPTTSILKIENSKGKILEEYQNKSARVLDEQIARLISNILSDEETRSPMFGQHSSLYLENIPTAAKTGTTEEYKDGWTIGYTPSLVVGVWAGNNTPTSMPRGSGLSVAAPIWNKFMKKAYELKNEKEIEQKQVENYFNLPEQKEQFTEPKLIVVDKPMLNGKFANEIKVKIDTMSKKLATEYTPPDLIEEEIYREVHCILYYINKNNPQKEGNSKNDPQFNNWEPQIISWALSLERKENYNKPPLQEYDDIHTKENQRIIEILSPNNWEHIKEKSISIKTYTKAPLGIKQLDFFLDNLLIGTDSTKPYQINFIVPENIKGKKHEIIVKVYDKYGSQKSDSINIYLEIPGIEEDDDEKEEL